MIKVCWISHHMHTPQMFLDSIIKMTPGRSGKWKDMVAVTNPDEADFIFVMDGARENIPLNRSIFFAEHPDCLSSYKNYESMKGRALLCLPLKKFVNPGEWWLDYDYDYLSALKAPIKTKKAICCFTAHQHKLTGIGANMYTDRRKFMEMMLGFDGSVIELYGRPASNFNTPMLQKYYRGVLGNPNPDGMKGEHQTGKEKLIDFQYSFEFDNGPTTNYFSERFYDAMLMWCHPIYWGSSNVHEYLPKDSFSYIDIMLEGEALVNECKKAHDIIYSNSREFNRFAIAEARDLMLNKYQMWAYMHNVIKNLDKYIAEWKK